MPKKTNPLNLNPLQNRTLALLQALARLPDHSRPGAEAGTRVVANIPAPHGDHFHIGDAVVAARDATGLGIEAAWSVLERKGLLKSNFPIEATLTASGLAYETGLEDQILHHHSH